MGVELPGRYCGVTWRVDRADSLAEPQRAAREREDIHVCVFGRARVRAYIAERLWTRDSDLFKRDRIRCQEETKGRLGLQKPACKETLACIQFLETRPCGILVGDRGIHNDGGAWPSEF